MRTRTATPTLLLAGVLTLSVTGCGGSGGSDTLAVAAPRPSKTALDLRTIPDVNGVVSTAGPTTLAPPTTLPPPTVGRTSTVLVPSTVPVSLPPGVTDDDRRAAEAAAIDWWEMVSQQLVALPNFDPKEVLVRAVPGTPGGPAMLEGLEERRLKKFLFIAGTVDLTTVERTEFAGRDDVSIDICKADNGYFVQDGTGKKEYEGLGSSYYTTVLRRVENRWLIVDFGAYRKSVEGKSCVV